MICIYIYACSCKYRWHMYTCFWRQRFNKHWDGRVFDFWSLRKNMFSLCIFWRVWPQHKHWRKMIAEAFYCSTRRGLSWCKRMGCFFFGGGEQNIQIGYLYRSYIYAQKVQRPNFAHLVVSGILWSWIILMISVFFWCAQDIPKLKRSGNDLIIGWPFATFG